MTPTNKDRNETQTQLRSRKHENYTNIQIYIASPTEREKRSLYNFKMHKTNNRNTKFNGCCLDMGATRRLVGNNNLKLIANLKKTKQTLKKSTTSFRFGVGVHQSLGTFNATLSIPNRSLIEIKTAVVPIDVPFLLGLDFFV